MSSHKYKISLHAETDPVVELDSQARAAYIRFSRRKVAKTEPLATGKCLVVVDFDSSGAVVGIELAGVNEFGIEKLMGMAGLSLPRGMGGRTRYVPANLRAA